MKRRDFSGRHHVPPYRFWGPHIAPQDGQEGWNSPTGNFASHMYTVSRSGMHGSQPQLRHRYSWRAVLGKGLWCTPRRRSACLKLQGIPVSKTCRDLVGCDTMLWCGRIPTFRIKLLLPSSLTLCIDECSPHIPNLTN